MKNNYFKRIVFTILLFSSFSMSYATDWYISPIGDDTNDGLTVLTPKKSFSAAQTAATAGDIIYVSGMIDFSLEPGITLPNGVAIAKDLTIQGTSNTTDGFDGKNLTKFFSSTVSNLTLKNIKLINGYSGIALNGGAILFNSATKTLVCENVIFESNKTYMALATARTGAAIQIDNSLGLTIKNCVFLNNEASKSGALFINSVASNFTLNVESCSFIGNMAKESFGGSAIYIRTNTAANATCNITNSTFRGNQVATATNGGTIYIVKSPNTTKVYITNCTITENTTAGGVTSSAGVFFLTSDAAADGSLYIRNSIIEGNTGALGVASDLNLNAVSATASGGTTGYAYIEKSIIGRIGTPANIVNGTNYVLNDPLINHLPAVWTPSDFKAKLGAFNSTSNSYPLTAASAALDLGSSALLSPITIDQLGITRPFTGGLCSAGSAEFIPTAGQKIWKGISTDPTVTSNWFPEGVPATTDFITIPIGKTNYPVFATDLTLNGGLIESEAKLTVTDALVNNGTLTIENNANLIQVNNVANSGSGSTIVKRDSSPLLRLDYTLWSSPVTNGAKFLTDFSPLTSQAPSRFYSFDTTYNVGAVNGAYSAIVSPTTTNFTAGSGYLIRMPNTDPTPNYDTGTATLVYPGVFSGTPNNGDVQVALIDGGAAGLRYNLVGNPYPSTVNMTQFVSDNSANIESTLHFWRKTNGAGTAYCTWVPGVSPPTGTFTSNGNAKSVDPLGILQTGQGFFVEAKSGASSLTFNNGQRVANTAGQFFKTKQVVNEGRVWLNATNAAGDFSQMAVTYSAQATQGIDMYDGKSINDSKFSLTSNIINAEYTIQSRPAFDATDVVALNFKTAIAGDYSIALDHFDGLFATGQDVYLVDGKTGAETNLKEGGYNFTAAAGVDNARFSLKYQKTLKVDAAAFNDNSVVVYKNKGTLYVNSATKAINNIKVYDVQGRLIAEQKNVKTNTATINNLKANNQVLIVKISAEDNSVVTKKVMN